MQKYLAPLILSLFLIGGPQLSAQRSGDASTAGFADRLWYGGGFILGFGSSNNFGLQETQFQFGISPMVGYKIFEELSVGPRAAFTYIHYRANLGGDVQTANPVTYALGIFGRFKIIPTLFAQVEYENENQALFAVGVNDIQVARRIRDNVYLGGGYTSGGIWATEIVLLYNVNQPNNVVQQPFVIRFGFTRNF